MSIAAIIIIVVLSSICTALAIAMHCLRNELEEKNHVMALMGMMSIRDRDAIRVSRCSVCKKFTKVGHPCKACERKRNK